MKSLDRIPLCAIQTVQIADLYISRRIRTWPPLWAELRGRGYCATVEPNQSLANAAICDRLAGHDGWCEGYACGPAAAERPGRHRWKIITYVGAHHDDF